MQKIFIFILFLSLFGCGNIIKNRQLSTDFNCPRVFFSSDDRVYIDDSVSLDNIKIKAEFNNFFGIVLYRSALFLLKLFTAFF